MSPFTASVLGDLHAPHSTESGQVARVWACTTWMHQPADGAAGLCAVGYTTGRVQLVCVGGLRLLKERRVHVAGICCMEFGPSGTLLTAAVDGEVRLHAATLGADAGRLEASRLAHLEGTTKRATCVAQDYRPNRQRERRAGVVL